MKQIVNFKVDGEIESITDRFERMMKMLGGYLNDALNNATEVNNLVSTLAKIEISLKRLNFISDINIRRQMANAVFIGRLNYFLPTYSNLTTIQIGKISKRLMRVARWVKGGPCIGISNHKILNECGWLPVKDQIQLAGLKVLHAIIATKEPQCLYDYIKIPRRATANIALARYPKKSKLKKFFLNQSLDDYNRLPKELKAKAPEKFKEATTKMFKKIYKVNLSVRLPM